MSQPYPLPKKYLMVLASAKDELQVLARRARTALEEVEAEDEPYQLARIILRDIEAEAYRLALELSTLEVTGSCDGCPSAPPTTEANVMLLVIAGELERQANIARSQALGKGRDRSAISFQLSENKQSPNGNVHIPESLTADG